MCKDLRCEICNKAILKIPRFCGNKCRGQDLKKWMLKYRSFVWKLATPEERQEHIKKYYMKNVIIKDGCWDWNKKCLRDKYPKMHFCRNEPKVMIHRYSWTLHKGEIPEGKLVLHKCDNSRCSNPDHLFLGTNNDNINDMLEKRRNPVGITHGCAKLTDDDIFKIRAFLAQGISLNKLAQEFNVAKKTILNIKQKKTWKHII